MKQNKSSYSTYNDLTLKKAIGHVKLIGLKALLISMFKIFFYILLKVKFKFHTWNVFNPYEFRPYKKEVVDLANKLKPKVIVEIGCGLGEIISRIKAVRKFGIDRSVSSVKAARFLKGNKVCFLTGSFENLQRIKQKEIDLLLIVNWIHAQDFKSIDIITKRIREFLQKGLIKHIIIDERYISRDSNQRFYEGLKEQIRDMQFFNDGGEDVRKIVKLDLIKDS